jgi:hypothetical protein
MVTGFLPDPPAMDFLLFIALELSPDCIKEQSGSWPGGSGLPEFGSLGRK